MLGASTRLLSRLAHEGAPVPGEGPAGSAPAEWWPLFAFVGVFVAICVTLAATGRSDPRHPRGLRPFLRIPDALERLTGTPAWAAATVGTSIYGLAVAGYGFYTDVAFHVAYGRDEVLFTSPHTAILVGLVMIAAAPVAGIVTASAWRQATTLRWGPVRVPWSMLPLGALGIAALTGFPVDELWHQRFGVDVTMWSPPHLLMILSASFSAVASWLVLAEARVRPTDGRWARGAHVLVAALTLLGLSSVQGEFSFGVPQWQQLYHPVLVSLAAGAAIVAIRLVHGPWWPLGITAALFALDSVGISGDGPVETRSAAIYLGSALAVELAAWLWGTADRRRFALAAGLGVGTLGLAVEWAWNSGAHQPWTTALLPEALLVGVPAAVAASLLGAAVGGVVAGDGGRVRVSGALIAVALVGVFVVLIVPMPRQTGDASVEMTLQWVDDDHAYVQASLDPPDAADNARWFTAGSWQYGGRRIAHMQPTTTPGEYVSAQPLRLTGWAKSLLRLHRGAEMMAAPIRMPADPAYDLPEIPAEDRETVFAHEQQYLQREAEPASGWFAWLVYALVSVLAVLWLGAFALAAARIGRRREPLLHDAPRP